MSGRKAIPVTARSPFVDELAWTSKSECMRNFQVAVLDVDPFTFTEQVTAVFILNALHPDWRSIYPRLVSIDRRATSQGNRRLFAKLTDGTEMLIRHWRAFAEGPRTRLANALRQVIFESISAFKRDLFARGEVHCAVTGRPLVWDECDIDHSPPWSFSMLVTAWLTETNRFAESFEFVMSPHADLSLLAIAKDAADFLAFHNTYAVLRPMHSHTNRFAQDYAASAGHEAGA